MKNNKKNIQYKRQGRTIFALMIFISMVFMLNSISAQATSLGTVKQGGCVQLYQTCANCTFNNITNVIYPNKSSLNIGLLMSSGDGFTYNWTFCNTQTLGQYQVYGYGDVDGTNTNWGYELQVTVGGDIFDIPQSVLLIAQFGIIALFFGIGMTFRQEKWKLRTFFFIAALLMGIILLNSIRIIVGTSTSLASMGNTGLILGIIVLSFMFLYMLIGYTIEIFKYFKNKSDMKWSVDSP